MTGPGPLSAGANVTAPWLTVVGVLPNGALGPTAPPHALDADAIFGANRLLDMLSVGQARRRPWPKPFQEGIDAVVARRGQPTTVLASGDPLHFGVAATLLKHIAAEEMSVHPAPDAFALAAAEMRWPRADITAVSLHDVPPDTIRGHLAPQRRLIALTRDGASPQAVAEALTDAGYGGSMVTVLENLGSAHFSRHDQTARGLSGTFAPLNTLAIACSRLNPISVDTLEHDGCVTRDEVRLLTIKALGEGRGHLWDVGAGSGAVAIDWCRAGGSATLFERDDTRVGAIHRNLEATATRAAVFEGEAEDALDAAAAPDAVFMGGSVSDQNLFEALWERLRSGGIMVSNAVTVTGEESTFKRFASHGGTLTRISLSHAKPVGRLRALVPAMPILQWRAQKP
ncbi:MAG: precorrin-6y C5,15-methyltransferase (decarboxylating) subunit CbiE [Pseudomonadota bacterium]